MLEIRNLTVGIDDNILLQDINMCIPDGETHILMGPNGSGKSTLIKTIMGMSGPEVMEGKIIFRGTDITDMDIDQRAKLGIGIALQNPPSVPEITLAGITDKIVSCNGKVDRDRLAEQLNCGYLMDRGLNHNLSGGERKRSELFQLMVQNPKLVMIDEPEAGVDLDNLVIVGNALKELLKGGKIKSRITSGLMITHTGNILEYVNADKGYILMDKTILCSGNPRDLFETISKYGYERCCECNLQTN
ncbi:MAG: ATP-binding cassette domain-containing protein [Clostridia bacterium]|nr:ATP-binding cassette domain-containing protein [Clostridia bacterium]